VRHSAGEAADRLEPLALPERGIRVLAVHGGAEDMCHRLEKMNVVVRELSGAIDVGP
jgi:hypothetical protein